MLRLNKITNLHSTFEELLEDLQQSLKANDNFRSAAHSLQHFCPSSQEISKFQIFSEERYVRNLVHRCDLFEVLVLCWQPGQASPVHNHRNSWCGMKTLQGTSTELKFEESLSGAWIPTEISKAPQHRVLSAYDTDMHVVGNFENTNLTTLHCYSPPLADYDVIPYSQTILEPMNKSYAAVKSTAAFASTI